MPRLALADLYLCHSVLAPDAGIEAYLTQIDAWLGRGRWRKKGDATWSKGGPARHRPPRRRAPVGRRADRDIPPGFRSVDVVILSDEFEVSRTCDSSLEVQRGFGAPWTGRGVPVRTLGGRAGRSADRCPVP
ncbi:hypothetical protein ACWGDS_07815 [Streptomyces sp. NPDC055059]|uniref:hypothetical protein n=1 Tax=Streptomyces sp. NPDC127172 TaxID=3345382 RepID=UPI003641F7E5